MKKLLLVALAGVMFTACGGDHFYPTNRVTKGDATKMDTLSYALGADVAYGLTVSMADVPFDYEQIIKGTNDQIDEATTAINHDSALVIVRTFFMQSRPMRARATAEKNAELLAADSTYVAPKVDPTLFESEEERQTVSHSFGMDLGYNIAQSGYPVQLTWFTNGFNEAVAGQASMTLEEVRSYLQNYFMKVAPELNKLENEEWLSKVEKNWGVKKTESGMLYKIGKKGEKGTMPTNDQDQVEVNYTGWNHKGQVFDTSLWENMSEEQKDWITTNQPDKVGKNREPAAKFPLGGVVKGWGEGLKLVGKGGKITLWLPSELAYGEMGSYGNPLIPGNEALKFEIEVLDVIPFEEPAPAEATPAVEEAQPQVVVEEPVVE